MELRMQLPLIESLMRVFASGLARLAARRRARRQALQLAAMSEHELLDLGIGRSEVPALLRAATQAGTDHSTRG
ncbi:hypothetical protein C7T35_36080 [Variovorax sp. WS11]|uniref:DUF1127 domain-containing protein n=1 Tax=Variovorax sp. WS11 TaxID=1105204 RepID=UPI000D0D2A2F|nr:DUF1127 domain-containing protein [Variovorax sp. WS11]NDZ13942.1 DUF1127 domain-containing protein [Variovorax sp. WS11]PSL79735.1 hypothetical protein C7T35_36080 [Variovorax sp. WS11]